MAIPTVLLFYAQRQKNVPFRYLFGLFGLFILSCGFTHYLDWYTFHTPMYRLSGVVKVITALASWVTVAALIPITPRALAMRSPDELERLVAERTRELKEANDLLANQIHERERVGKLLQDRTYQVEALNASLEARVRQRTADLQATNEELESFCYSVSHDLRQPLRAIDGFTYAVLQEAEERLEEDHLAYLQRVRAATKRMDTLITALLKLSRVHRSDIRTEPVDLAELAASVVSDLEAADPDRRVTVTIQPGLVANMDANMARVLIQNLIGNAWKFTASRDDARIEFGKVGDEFFVRDNGIGFDPKFGHKLFQPFERLETSEAYEGSGVGLATAERIVRRHMGEIRAEGVPGEGATFWFRIATREE